MNAITNFIEDKLIMGKIRLSKMTEEFLSEERGDTNFVSIMLIIVIVIAAAALFKNALLNVINNVMNKLNEATT